MNDLFVSGFLKTLCVVKNYPPVIVIGGGWAPFIYHQYLLENKSHEPILTRDIDFMVPATVPVIGKKTVDQVLVEAGFEAVFKNTVSVTNQPAFSVYLAFMLCLTIVYPFVPTACAINRNYPQRAHHAQGMEKIKWPQTCCYFNKL